MVGVSRAAVGWCPLAAAAAARRRLPLLPPQATAGIPPAAGAPRPLRAARLHRLQVRSAAEEPATAAPEVAAPAAGNGAAEAQHSEAAAGVQANGAPSATVTVEELPEQELVWVEPSGGDKTWTSWKLLWALPWRRFKSGSVLTLKLSGAIAEQPQGRFSQVRRRAGFSARCMVGWLSGCKG